jgi:F-type H+-transporting ATPase subunit a
LALELRPLEQFKIEPLIPIHIGGLDVSYTNASLFMTIAVVLITALLVLGTKRGALVPGRWQSVAEMSYEFVADMVDTNSGHGAEPFFPFIFTLFMFVLFANFLGLIPYSYTVTSQIVVTFALAATVFVGVTFVGFAKHGLHFFRFFVPEGVPIVLLFLLVPIELLSYCIRPFTLAIRLFANMLAGHTMLAIFGGFAASVGLAAIFPVLLDVAIYALEVLVAALQAYVFAILTALYLRDALHMH